jgi:signal transduction histidine kinase/CheY-like chemotaxis protein
MNTSGHRRETGPPAHERPAAAAERASAGCRRGLPVRVGGWLARVLLALVAGCAFMVPPLAWAQAEPSVVITQARFTALSPAAAAPLDVTLPDTWAQRGLSRGGEGRYELRWQIAAMPTQPLGLSIDRVSSTRRVWLNGHVIEDTRAVGQGHPVSRVLGLPEPLLRLGENVLVVEVNHRLQGGLSPAEVGDKALLQRAEAHESLLTRELPRSLNMGVALLAALLLLVRWRRPSEQSLGLFGALALLGSFRNYSYFMDVGLVASPIGDWLYFAAQGWTILIFLAFALSLHAQRQPGGVDRALFAAAIAVPALGAVGAWFGVLNSFRTVVYPVLLLLGLTAITVIWRAVRNERSLINIALVLGFLVLMVAGAHDYAFQQGHLPVTDFFWVPYAMPLAFGVYGLLQMNRFVQAMNDVERLNRELEHRVQQRTRALQSANAAKTRFLAAASHDLRQPVAAIGLMVSLMREQIAQPALRKMIDRVDEALASMETLLKGLLDLSRLESGTARSRPERVMLQPLFDAIALHESEDAARKGLRLRFRPTRLAVRSDPVLLEQMLRNLVSNALRYTERGGVLVAARAQGDQVLLQVWDTGIGIAEQDQAQVFDEFVQLGNNAREGTRGLGLGLSIVKRSAALLQHPLELRSRVGRGSCFGLRVPREADAPELLRPVPLPSRPLDGQRIVLVEDDAAMRESLAERLGAWGAHVQAFDGVPALRAALPAAGTPRPPPEQRFADLLITDQRLPGGSGLLVIELVRQRCGATRAMVVTGDTSPGDLNLLQSSGVPVLHKPFRAEALLATIERALQASAIGELPV